MKKYFDRIAILLALVMVGFGSANAQEAGDRTGGQRCEELNQKNIINHSIRRIKN